MERLRFSTTARVGLLVPLLFVGAAQARAADPRPPLIERVYRLADRPATEAVAEVLPMLSAHGSVEIRHDGRELVVRDLAPVVERVLERLAAGERGEHRQRIAVQIVRADDRPPEEPAAAGAAGLELPADIVARLHRLLRYRSFSLLARADFEAEMEAESTFDVGSEFRVSFRLARVADTDRLVMREFRVLRRDGHGGLDSLVHTHLSLATGRPMILGLAPTEASERALILVLEAGPGAGWREALG